MPQRKPSPPERAAIGGTCDSESKDDSKDEVVGVEVEEEEDEDEDEGEELLFLLQHITSCFSLASMAQKKPLSPNAAEMGPIDPNPDAEIAEMRRRRRINMVVLRICMAGLCRRPPRFLFLLVWCHGNGGWVLCLMSFK